MSVLVTSGVTGGGSGVDQIQVVVATTITENIAILPIAANLSAKWIITITDAVLDRAMAYEVLGVHRQAINASHNVYAQVGDIIPHNVDVQVIGTDLVLLVTNNEVHDITVNAVQVPTFI